MNRDFEKPSSTNQNEVQPASIDLWFDYIEWVEPTKIDVILNIFQLLSSKRYWVTSSVNFAQLLHLIPTYGKRDSPCLSLPPLIVVVFSRVTVMRTIRLRSSNKIIQSSQLHLVIIFSQIYLLQCIIIVFHKTNDTVIECRIPRRRFESNIT